MNRIMKKNKAYLYLAFGIVFYILGFIFNPARYFPSSNGHGFTFMAMLYIFLTCPIIFHALILGFIVFIVAKGYRDKIKGFGVFAMLFFASGLYLLAQIVFLF